MFSIFSLSWLSRYLQKGKCNSMKGRTGHTVKLLFITLTFFLPQNSHVIKTHHGCPNPCYFSRNMYIVAFLGGWSIKRITLTTKMARLPKFPLLLR